VICEFFGLSPGDVEDWPAEVADQQLTLIGARYAAMNEKK